jgi:hypothetical protein
MDEQLSDVEYINKMFLKSMFLTIRLGQLEINRAVDLMNMYSDKPQFRLNLMGTENIVYNCLYSICCTVEQILENFGDESVNDILKDVALENFDRSALDNFMSGFARFRKELKQKEYDVTQDA